MAERTSLDKVDPKTAWLPWEPTPKDPWNLKWAGHLYRRSAFGASLATLRFAVEQGLEATVNDLTGGDGDNGLSAIEKNGAAYAKDPNGGSQLLQSWWLRTLLENGHPLREKMTLFWHNHFVSSIAKVQNGTAIFKQNQALRYYALKKFGSLLLATSKDPAMLIYLDSNSNVKGKPNENYAREVMELFSLGVGNYTEKDIQEAARAFTGWHVETHGDANMPASVEYDFAFKKDLHDFGPKKVLGLEGNLDGGDVIKVLLEQPCCAKYLVRKLYRFFISETAEPPDALIDPLAERYRKSVYDTGDIVKTMIRSRHFFSEHAYHQRIKSPVEFVFGVAQACTFKKSWPLPEKPLVGVLEAMGQTLLAPPNVKGWPGGKAWLNTSTMLARHNFAQLAATGQWPDNSFGGNILGGALADDVKKEGDDAKAAPETDDPPEAACDVGEFIRREKCKGPEEIVNRLVDLFLQDAIPADAHTKLVAYMSEAKEDFASQATRVRACAHLIMTMPQYQLA
jgi:uncharacterized protein (DUF1800 family)